MIAIGLRTTEHLTIESKKSLQFEGWIPQPTAERLFSMSGLSYAEMKAKAIDSNFKSFKLNAQFTSRISNKYRKVKSQNEVAMHEGNDAL